MKLSLIYFIILISLLYNASSSSDDIFKKGGYINVPESDGKVVFNATDIEDNEEISFEIKAKLFNQDKIKYEFSDNYDLTTYTDTNAKQLSPYKKNETDPNLKYYYYKISENVTKNYLILNFDCVGNVTITNILTPKPSTSNDKILKKYGTIEADALDYSVIMDTSGFKKGENIYLKIRAREFIDNYLYYEFFDNINTYEPRDNWDYYEYINKKKTESDYKAGYFTNYYEIKKDDTVLHGVEGNYLALFFFVTSGRVTITNTKEDEGKLSTGAIVGIIIAVVVIIAIVIIGWCIKRRKHQQYQNQPEVVVSNNQNYNQQYNNNQNYNQQYNNNQNYNQNQMYGANSNDPMAYPNNNQQQNYPPPNTAYPPQY